MGNETEWRFISSVNKNMHNRMLPYGNGTTINTPIWDLQRAYKTQMSHLDPGIYFISMCITFATIYQTVYGINVS